MKDNNGNSTGMSAVNRAAAFLFAFLAVKSILFALLVPPYLGNDEPNHFEYVLLMAGEGEGKSNQKGIIDSLNRTGYWKRADMKPPPKNASLFRQTELLRHSEEISETRPFLYYWIASWPVRMIDSERLTTKLAAARMVSAFLSVLAVWLIYLSARIVFEGPSQSMASLTAASLAGFHPQFSYISAVVNSDVLTILIFSSVFYWIVVHIKKGGISVEGMLVLFAMLGFAMLTKKISIGLFPIVLIGIALLSQTRPLKTYLMKTAGAYLIFFFFLLAGLLILEFFATTDVIKLADRITLATGYFTPTAEDLGRITLMQYLRSFAIIFVTWWFTYGQMVYKLSFGFYIIYAALTFALMAGFAVKVVRLLFDGVSGSPTPRYIAFSVLFIAVVFAMMALTFFTPRYIDRVSGRYLFYAIAPITIIAVYGLREISQRIKRVDLELSVVYIFIAMNLLALAGYLAPLYHA